MYKKQYDTKKYPFSRIISSFFEVEKLTELHLLDKELCEGSLLSQENEAETSFHKKYYKKLNSGWPELTDTFTSFVESEISKIIKGPFLYQTTPSFRVHVPNQTAVSKWHYDSDPNHGHPDWEINIQIALTKAYDTSATWVESVPGLGNYQPMNLSENEYIIFNESRESGCDLTKLSSIKKTLKRINPDIIINGAAHVGGVGYVSEYAATVCSENVEMYLNLFKAIKKYNRNILTI